MSMIYQPAGKAREYADWACNLYRGCAHACTYCYAPAATHRDRAQFAQASPRTDILECLKTEAPKLSPCQVHLCFTCDPYQPQEAQYRITRRAIEILHASGHSVRILTKGGLLAQRDFDLLGPKDAFGATLTCISPQSSQQWEPKASLPAERIANLKAAHERGIPTWASLEPVLDPQVTLSLIALSAAWVDTYKVGRWNYDARAATINWAKFGAEAEITLKQLGKAYLFKADLLKAMQS